MFTFSVHTGKESPLVLFNIPDGHTKSAMPVNSVQPPVTINKAKVIYSEN